jgi:hypothetical protein
LRSCIAELLDLVQLAMLKTRQAALTSQIKAYERMSRDSQRAHSLGMYPHDEEPAAAADVEAVLDPSHYQQHFQHHQGGPPSRQTPPPAESSWPPQGESQQARDFNSMVSPAEQT